jgi:6-phosphofructokinase
MARKIGIVNSGGDCAGLNAVIASVVKSGVQMGYEFVGFRKGFEGILSPIQYRELSYNNVRGISHLGGTILGSTTHGRFGSKVGEGETHSIPDEILSQAVHNLNEIGVEGLVVIGGDGTLSSASQLAERGVNIVGVPKTIDNDLRSTDRTFGFSTAVQVAVDALDKVHTTATSHDRTIFVECMGRHAGWIALFAGLAGGADAILLPEFPFSVERLIEFLRDRRRIYGGLSNIVVVAEGVKVAGKLSIQSYSDDQEVSLGGISVQLMNEVEKLAPDEFEMRHVVLGHIQRGGSPNSDDRILAKEYGVAAMMAYHSGQFNTMVSLKGGHIEIVPLADAIQGLKTVTSETREYQTAKTLGIFID